MSVVQGLPSTINPVQCAQRRLPKLINLQVGKGGLPPLEWQRKSAGVNHPSSPANSGNQLLFSNLGIFATCSIQTKDLWPTSPIPSQH